MKTVELITRIMDLLEELQSGYSIPFHSDNHVHQEALERELIEVSEGYCHITNYALHSFPYLTKYINQ